MKKVFTVKTLLFLSAFLGFQLSFSQSESAFHIYLRIDYSAAEQTIALFENRLVNTQFLAELRGNRVAAMTTELISNRGNAAEQLKNYFDSLKYHRAIGDDIYHLEESRRNVALIKELLQEMKSRNFNRRVAATVEQIFPKEVSINAMIPVYVVALGHENVNAYVRRIIWDGDIPQFLGGEKGELTIVINLARSVKDADNLEERFISLLSVVAHEVFHVAFDIYKEHSPTWKEYRMRYRQPIDILLELTHNEGIAYYLSLEQAGRGYLPREWNTRTREAFQTFNKNAEELLSERVSRFRVNELLRQANLSGYWESYGSVVGMVIAREIDLKLGRKALIETISSNPFHFFQKYLRLMDEYSTLPKLSDNVCRFIIKESALE